MIDQKYNIIYADPAWWYPKRDNKHTKFGGGIHGKYTGMTEAELVGMGDWVKSISEKNCLLFMWATGPWMMLAGRVMEAWGFKYSTVAFTWLKVARKVKLPDGSTVPWNMIDERIIQNASIIKGPGNWTGSNQEYVLLGTRGSVTRVEKLVPQVIVHPRLPRHSAKPPEVRDRIVRLVGDIPRIELFARDVISGWTVSGIEVDGVDYRTLKAA